RREQQKEAGFARVRDPQFTAGETIFVTGFYRPCGQCECIRTRAGFRECVTGYGVLRSSRQPSLALLTGSPPQNRVVEQRILHVHDDGGGRIYFGQLLDRENRLKKRSALAA